MAATAIKEGACVEECIAQPVEVLNDGGSARVELGRGGPKVLRLFTEARNHLQVPVAGATATRQILHVVV